MAETKDNETSQITDEEIRGAVRSWMDNNDLWQKRFRDIRDATAGYLFHHRDEVVQRLSKSTFSLDIGPGPAAAKMDMLQECISILEHSDYNGFAETSENFARVEAMIVAEVQRHVDKRYAELFDSEPTHSASTKQTEHKKSPLFSKNVQAFLKDKAYDNQTRRQNEATYRLWDELIGDKPVRDYSGEDADQFRTLLLQMPASHGKGGKINARKLIDEAQGTDVPRLTMKTVKRHFSAMSQYWVWLKPRGGVDTNIFSGFSFPGSRSTKAKRDVWSPDDLARFFLSSEWQNADQESALYWLPLLSLHSGIRLEEGCRLRPRDVEKIADVWCLRIQDHPDGWSPKTEAGQRDIPIHSWLISAGFIDHVEERRREKAERIFVDLVPGGPDKRYGYSFSRSFSKLLRTLQVNPKTVFHSFRHTFRTALDETDHLDRHIAMVGGWERAAQDEGSRTYALTRS